MNTVLLVLGLLAACGFLFAWALCRIAGRVQTIDQGESFGGEYDDPGR